jgi:hypothetical protein
MAKTSPDLSEYIPKYPRYPKDLSTMAVKDAIVIKTALNVYWTQSHDIANQIVAAVRQGAHANGGKTTNAAAMAKWRNLLQPHVYSVLFTGGDWAASSANVLIAAGGMGDIASTLTSGAECKENQLKAAFRAAKLNTVCLTGGSGGGNWCTFDWF